MLSARYPHTHADIIRPELHPKGVIDRSLEVRRLRKNLLGLIRTSRSIFHHGNSSLVENLAALDGWLESEIIVMPVRIRHNGCHLVTTPPAIWRKNTARLLNLKHKAVENGQKVFLVPPAYIQREPRMTNVRMIEDAFYVSITAEDRMAVFIHLLDHGGYSTFADCANAVVNNEAPFSCVLSMVGMGLIDMDLGKPFNPETRVDLPQVSS